MAANSSNQYPSFDLSGKRALVTGATKGIGRHAALSLAHAGADLFLAGRDADDLAELAAAVRAMGRRAETAQADLAEVAAARRGSARPHMLYGRVAAIDHNLGPGDHVRGIGGQEHDGAGHIAWHTKLPEWDFG